MSEEERSLTPGEAPELPEVQPPEEALSGKLAETADEVKSGLQDLLPEQPPAQPADQLPAELAESAEQLSVEPPAETTAAVDQAVEGVAGEVEPEPAPLEVEPAPPEVEPAPPLREESAAAGLPPAPAAATKLVSAAAVESTSDDRLMSMLAWLTMAILQLPIVSIIQLVSTGAKDRPLQRHHAIMSLMFYVVGIAYEIVAAIVFTIISAVTLGCGAACLWIIFFVPQAFALYFALQAYNGKLIELPLLSNFARQQGWL